MHVRPITEQGPVALSRERANACYFALNAVWTNEPPPLFEATTSTTSVLPGTVTQKVYDPFPVLVTFVTGSHDPSPKRTRMSGGGAVIPSSSKQMVCPARNGFLGALMVTGTTAWSQPGRRLIRLCSRD